MTSDAVADMRRLALELDADCGSRPLDGLAQLGLRHGRHELQRADHALGHAGLLGEPAAPAATAPRGHRAPAAEMARRAPLLPAS